MKVRHAVIGLLALTSAVAVACGDDDDPTGGGAIPELYVAELTGAAERPDPVATTATGTATINFTPGSGNTGQLISYSVTVTGLTGQATEAHIHGPAGVDAAAPVIVALTIKSGATSGVIISGTIASTGHPTISMDSLVVLLRNGNSYINVHNAPYPDGEIRGQFTRR